MIVLTGISASGKSTVADLLARRFGRGAHVRGDVFRRMVVAGRAEMTSAPTAEARQQLRLRYSLSAATADAYFEAGFSVVVQDIIIGEALKDFVEMMRSRPLCVVVLSPRRDVVAAREAARGKVAYRTGFDGIDALDSVLHRGTPRLGLWLDSSDQTPEQTVDEIVSRARNEGRLLEP